MAGSAVAVTIINPLAITGRGYNDEITVIADWTSDSGTGAVTGALATLWTASKAAWQPTLTKLRGYIRSIETIPGASGDHATALPSDQYDVTLTDAYGKDLAGGELANRSGTVADAPKIPDQPIWVDSEVTINVTNAGNSTKGRLILHMSAKG